MKKFSLNAEQKILVEKNLGIVKLAIHKSIIVNDNLYGFAYDDLYQEGCIWLCKAALSFDESRGIRFAAFAEKVVTNGLFTYCRLMRGNQKHHILLPTQSKPDERGCSFEKFLAEDMLFSGDTLFAGDCGRCDLFGGDFSKMKASLKRLAALPGDYTVYPGHGPASRLSYEREHNPYIEG